MTGIAYAQGAAAAPAAGGFASFVPLILIFGVFYFLLIRPQKKTQQEHAKMIENLQKNDEVITAGGMYGTIVNIQNDIVTLRVDDNTRIKLQKSSISKLKKPKN